MPDVTDSPALDSASPITFRDARVEDVPVLAHLMYTEISWGRLRDFGIGFLKLLNRTFCTSPHAVCIVAEADGRIVAYLAAVSHLRLFYREFLVKRGLLAAIVIVPTLFRPNMLATLWKGLTYQNDPGPKGPQSEILVIAVARGFSGRGIATTMLRTAMEKLRAKGVDAVRMGTVSEGNQAAMAVYTRCGFKVVRTQSFYGDTKVHVMEYRFESAPQ